MKLSESKLIKSLNALSAIVLVLFCVILLSRSFSYTAASGSIKDFHLYDVKAIPKNVKPASLENFFKQVVLVQPVQRAAVDIRIKSYEELLSFPAILFQFLQLLYWINIGLLIVCVKKLFGSFRRDEVFTQGNAVWIMTAAIGLMCLPLVRWLTQESMIYCIDSLQLNDSDYILKNGAGIFGAETLIGLAIFAFALVFKTGVDLKQENEAII